VAVGPGVVGSMTMTQVGGVLFHDGGLESEVHGPTKVARSVVCCSMMADQVDGVQFHSGSSVGGHRVPWRICGDGCHIIDPICNWHP
jgi:hypothetical protein